MVELKDARETAALCDKKKTRQHITVAVLDLVVGRDITEEVESKFYQNIQENFALWKCLLHLDMEAAVSFCGLNVSRIAREMESYTYFFLKSFLYRIQ
jgi:hypothetical protein